MIKTKKIIATLGVVAGLGMAAAPLAANALAGVDAVVTVTVGSQLSLTIDSATVNIPMDVNDVDTSVSSKLTVSTNTAGYNITVKDVNGDGSLVHTVTNSFKIAPITDGTAPQAGDGKWGLKVGDNWYGVSNTAKNIKNASAGAVTNEVTNVTYGVGTAASQAAGDYTATIHYEVTAAN